MTTVYFVQHGIALGSEIDQARPLSDSGADAVTKVALFLKKRAIQVESIHHSGKLRAEQTARLFAEAMNVSDVSSLSGMNPNDAPGLLIAQLNKDRAMYVGHLPNIQRVVCALLMPHQDAPVVRFQNAAVACVDLDNAGAGLNWFITPELC